MTDHQPDQHDERLFAYADGEMSPEESAAFERELMRDPALRDRLGSLRSIDEGLTRIADPKNAPAAAPATTRRRLSGPVLWGALAASIVVVGALVVQFSTPSAPAFTPKPHAERRVSTAEDYRRITHTFEPHIVCDTPGKFARYTVDAFGAEIGADFDAGTTLVGWRAYGSSYDPDEPAPSRRVLLARSPGEAMVIAYFIPEGLERPEVSLDGGLTMFESRIEGVHVIEITPDDEPSVLPVLIGDRRAP